MIKKLSQAALALVAAAGVAYAVTVFTGNLVNETALAYDKSYVLDLFKHSIHSVSAAATFSTATVATDTFQDGQQSKGHVTVANFANLNAAKAVNHLTILNNNGLRGAIISLPGYWFQEGLDWRRQATATATAASIATALSKVAGLGVHAAGTVIYATAPANGSYYNSLSLKSSTPTALSVFSSHFVGGLDNAVLKINGTQLRAGLDYTAATSNAATATSIRDAINNNASLKKYITASANAGVVYATSNYNGANTNFALFTSTQASLALSGSPTTIPGQPGAANSVMAGGITSAYAINSPKISITNHGLTRALAVLYTQGALIGGLTDQTTYYAIPVDVNTVELASSKNNAVAGTFITFTSSTTQLSQHTASLAPLPFTDVAGFKWQLSNDNSNWDDLTVASITVHSTDLPGTFAWDFGPITLRYLRANVTAPTTGGLQVKIDMVGNTQ